VEVSRAGANADPDRVPALVPVRILVAEQSHAVQRLMNVAHEMKQPAKIHCLVDLAAVADLVRTFIQDLDGVNLSGWRLMLGGIDAAALSFGKFAGH
jgi:hypothetical protein